MVAWTFWDQVVLYLLREELSLNIFPSLGVAIARKGTIDRGASCDGTATLSEVFVVHLWNARAGFDQ